MKAVKTRKPKPGSPVNFPMTIIVKNNSAVIEPIKKNAFAIYLRVSRNTFDLMKHLFSYTNNKAEAKTCQQKRRVKFP